MVIAIALGIIVAAVVALLSVPAYDISRRPVGERYARLKEWQQLIGAVLGFVAAAGVLVLGNALQREQERVRATDISHSIGTGLAIEAERLSQGLRAGQYMAGTITFGTPEDARNCALFFSELKRYMIAETPVYTAVLSHLSDFGDQNLAWFVRFYGVYGDILRGLGQPDTCSDGTAQADVGYISSLINGGLQFYSEIATQYAITPAATDQQIQQQMAAPPATPTAAPEVSTTITVD